MSSERKEAQEFNGNGPKNNEQQQNNSLIANFNGDFEFSTSSSPDGSHKSLVYRGATAVQPQMQPQSLDMFGMSAPAAMQKATQTVINTQIAAAPLDFGSMGQPLQLGGLGGLSDPAPMSKPSFDIITIDSQPLDISEYAPPPAFFIPSKCGNGLKGGGLQKTPMIFNEFTSCVVDESPNEVLTKFNSILSTYSNDIDFTIDYANYVISGTVYIAHFAVMFKISVWEEPLNDRTRFEFRRSNGDCTQFDTFYNAMLSEILKQFSNVETKQQQEQKMPALSFGALDYDLNGMSMDDDQEVQQGISKQELDSFIFDLQNYDPSSSYMMAMIVDALNAQSFVKMVLTHVQFMQCIVQNALKHQDTAIVRGALVALETMCSSTETADMIVNYGVLDELVPLLQHQSDLIAKYTVRVLSKLSMAKTWKFGNAKLIKVANASCKLNQNKWKNSQFATNDFIQSQMFNNIQSKLITV